MILLPKVVLRSVVLSLEVGASCSLASSEILEPKTRHGKQFLCMQSGLFGGWEECGTQDYIAVFRGKAAKVVEVSEWELELTVNVEEAFKGDLTGTVKFGTSQGVCFDDLNEGSEWLFFLEKDEKTGKPYLNYFSRNPSGPVAARGEELARLRKLQLLHGEGMIIGSVRRASHGKETDYSTLPGYKVVARDSRTGKEYSTMTDSNGKFVLEPLPSGTFSLIPPRLALIPKSSAKVTVDVAPGGCSSVDLSAGEEAAATTVSAGAR